MAAPGNAGPRELAGLVICSRSRFGQIHDEVWKELSTNDIVRIYAGEPFMSAILLDDLSPPANDRIAFERAFAAASEGEWLKPLVSRLLEQRAIDQSVIGLMRSSSQSAAMTASDAMSETMPKTEFEAAVEHLVGYTDPNLLISGLQRTIPKICLVSARLPDGKQSQATGFLIGAQAIMTAWHVIAPLLNAAGEPLELSDKRLSVEFDFLDPLDGGSATRNVTSYDVQQEWLGENSPCYASEVPSAEGITIGQSRVEDEPMSLDFAVIRLKGSPGRDRGVIKLRAEPLRSGGSPINLLVFQHPNRFPQRIAGGLLTRWCNLEASRFRHAANTAQGSSGGLCLDSQFESVGLHQAAILDDHGKAVENQGVPTALIARRLQAAYTVDDTLAPLFELEQSLEPVIGREAFQRSLWQATYGALRVVVVRGIRRHGLSFSERILRSLLSRRDVTIVHFTADEVGRDASVFAEKLLVRCGGTLSEGDTFPSSEAAATTAEAWLRDQLLPDVVRRIKEAIPPGSHLWIVVDDIDRHDIPEDKAFDLLLKLMTARNEASFLRFLLIGMDKLPTAVPPGIAESDVPGPPLTADIDMYIRRYCTAAEKHVSDEERQHIVEAVMRRMRSTQGAQVDPWGVVLQVLQDYLPARRSS